MEKKNHENREERAGARRGGRAMLAAGPVLDGGLFGAGVPAAGPVLAATGPAPVISGTTATVAVLVRAAAGWGRRARRAVLAGVGAGTFTLGWAAPRAVADDGDRAGSPAAAGGPRPETYGVSVGRRCPVRPDDEPAGREQDAGPRERERIRESMSRNGSRRRAGRRAAAVLAVAGLAGAGLAAQAASAATTTFSVTATIGVGGKPEGVAVDPDTGTVYVTNLKNNNVSVIDEATNQVTTTIGVGVGAGAGADPAGAAVDPDT